jgi:hypothetical protein
MQSPGSPPEERAVVSLQDAFEAVKIEDLSTLRSYIHEGMRVAEHVTGESSERDASITRHLSLPDASPKRSTLLHWACFLGHLDAVKLLVVHGADVNASESDGKSPLHWAAYQGFHDVCVFLLSRDNIQSRVPDKLGNTPCHLALLQRHYDVARLFPNYVAITTAAAAALETPGTAHDQAMKPPLTTDGVSEWRRGKVPNGHEREPSRSSSSTAQLLELLANEAVRAGTQRRSTSSPTAQQDCTPPIGRRSSSGVGNDHQVTPPPILGARVLETSCRVVPLPIAVEEAHQRESRRARRKELKESKRRALVEEMLRRLAHEDMNPKVIRWSSPSPSSRQPSLSNERQEPDTLGHERSARIIAVPATRFPPSEPLFVPRSSSLREKSPSVTARPSWKPPSRGHVARPGPPPPIRSSRGASPSSPLALQKFDMRSY